MLVSGHLFIKNDDCTLINVLTFFFLGRMGDNTFIKGRKKMGHAKIPWKTMAKLWPGYLASLGKRSIITVVVHLVETNFRFSQQILAETIRKRQ